jgi:plastocyanin
VSPRSAAFAALAAVLVLAASAQAATKTVYMGAPPSAAKALGNLRAEANEYFPSRITVRRGDKVRFVPAGLHTVDFLKGGTPVPLVSGGAPVSGARDAAGLPFWFNGQPELQLSPSLLNIVFGKTFSYNGSGELQSGLPVDTKPLTVKFPKTGVFTYFCNVHPGMSGTVNVIGGKPPSAKADAKVVKKQAKQAVKDARDLQHALVAKNQVLLGNSSRSGVEVLAMYPGQITVPVGSTVTFSISRWSRAAHTATTGPGDPFNDPGSFLGKISSSITSPPFDQAGVYPSDPRGAPALLTPNLHGNGFWSSGFMDRANSTPQPKTQQVKIVAPGTYAFYCMLHPFMRVVVNAQ